MHKEAEQNFYKAVGPDLEDRVIVYKDGVVMNGRFTAEQLRIVHAAYNKYLGGQIRKAFGYEGCPIILVPKPRPKTIEPVRKRMHAARARKTQGEHRKPKARKHFEKSRPAAARGGKFRSR